MEAHDMLQAAHDTIDKMLLETAAVAAGKEQGVARGNAEADKRTIYLYYQ